MSGVGVEVRGLCYDYPGGVAALRGVDLVIPPGGRIALLGANGAGKTSLLLQLNGTLRPSRGGLWLGGRPVSYSRAGLTALRQHVGLVLQDPDDQLFAASVRQDLCFGPLNLGLPPAEAEARAEEAAAALEITALLERPTHALSLGQKRRVAIAGALAMRPAILVLDEPTAGLDPAGVEALLLALDGLWRRGTALVFSTHDVDLALQVADEVALLHRGQLSRQGPARELLADEELLRAHRLGLPWGVRVVRALWAAGKTAPLPLPRTPTELEAYLHAALVGKTTRP